jgi:uncharacterized cupin superfamily protein
MRSFHVCDFKLSAGIAALAVFFSSVTVAQVSYPAKLSEAALGGAAFADPSTTITEVEGEKTLDFTSLKSSDGKFASGMYKAGPQVFDITDPYGVDEFMFFLEGSVILTSSDGTAMTVNAGEAVTIPKEWIGRWETEGYRKIWVIYSEDGSGL